jgi:hypothetical protein
MSLEHRRKFFSKGSRAMVLGLVPNIRDRCFSAGYADAERAVSFLRFKRSDLGKRFVHPFGRIDVEKLQRLNA